MLTQVKHKLKGGFKTLKLPFLFYTNSQNMRVSKVSRNKRQTLIHNSFVEKINCILKINSALLCTHSQGWCMFCMAYTDTCL